MHSAIVLVMHGAPPNDFPQHETREYFHLRGLLDDDGGRESSDRGELAQLRRRYAELDSKMRDWPRTAENDPYCAGSESLAGELGRATGLEVVLAFNDFCAPSLDDALDKAVSLGGERIIAVTPMMTAGGGHSEVEIPEAIERARRRFPDIKFIYAWPFEVDKVADFLATQINRFI